MRYYINLPKGRKCLSPFRRLNYYKLLSQPYKPQISNSLLLFSSCLFSYLNTYFYVFFSSFTIPRITLIPFPLLPLCSLPKSSPYLTPSLDYSSVLIRTPKSQPKRIHPLELQIQNLLRSKLTYYLANCQYTFS